MIVNIGTWIKAEKTKQEIKAIEEIIALEALSDKIGALTAFIIFVHALDLEILLRV